MDLVEIRKKAKKSKAQKELKGEPESPIKEEEKDEGDRNSKGGSEEESFMENGKSDEEPNQEKIEKKERREEVKDKKEEIKLEIPELYDVSQKQVEEIGYSKEKKIEKLLIFKVGKNRYAIPIAELSQIIEDRSVTEIPFVPSFVKGIFSLRGRIVGVIDVLERMNLKKETESLTKKIIILERNGDLFGLRIDSIDHVVDIDLNSLEQPPEGFDEASAIFVSGVFHYKNRTVAFLNLEKFFDF